MSSICLSSFERVLESRYFARAVMAGRGLSFDDRDLVEGVVALAQDEVVKRFKDLPTYQKRAASAMFRSVARGVTEETMSRVREQLLKDVARAAQSPPEQRERIIRRSLGRVGVAGADRHVVRTVVDTQTAMAEAAAQWALTRGDPDVWGYELVAWSREKSRPEHWVMNGVRYPKEHRFWRRYAPPNGFNCHCRLRAIRRGDRRARTKPFVGTPQVDPGFRFNPGIVLLGVG